MSKNSQRVQVSNPHCDLDQVTRIPLKLGQYKVTIAIAAACIFIGAGLLPEIVYLVLIKVVGLELWIGTPCSPPPPGAVVVRFANRMSVQYLRLSQRQSAHSVFWLCFAGPGVSFTQTLPVDHLAASDTMLVGSWFLSSTQRISND
jgi:hypothetical protein